MRRIAPSQATRAVVGAAAAVAACLGSTAAAAAEGTSSRIVAGPYSFSDELGGFLLRSATGDGTRDNPVVIHQELLSASPVTLVIRTVAPIRPFDTSGRFANGDLYLRLVTTNNSGIGWLEFEFELQERIGEPSTFGDGLSFDQREEQRDPISSDAFGAFSRDFEPYDKLLFRDGRVDAGKVVTFTMKMTDYTPRWEFYLVQDPRIPAS